MHSYMKKSALSLCLLTALSTPAFAAEGTPISADGPRVMPISADGPRVMPISADGIHVMPISADGIHVMPISALPSAVVVGGHAVTFDQAPVVVNNILMVPVRAVAEAAGGTVTWADETQTVQVQTPNRTILIRINQGEVEVQKKDTADLGQNRIALAAKPVLLNGRTLISADALSTAFGFQMESQPDGTLGISALPDWIEKGTISELQTGERTRFLLSGAPIANGEANSTWALVSSKTQITVQEGGQQRAGSIADLQVGAMTTVKFTGPMLRSYPPQGIAAEILIQK